MSSTATVAFVPLRNSLANLPKAVTNVLFNSNTPAQNVLVELLSHRGLRSTHSVFVGWTGMASASSTTVEVDPTFAQAAGLVYNSKVMIKLHGSAPVAHTVHLEPLTTGDWEIVETNAGFLESWMINQVRAVTTKHPITVFPSPTAIATLKVVKIEPPLPAGTDFARLSPTSEVVVAPKLRQTQSAAAPQPQPHAQQKLLVPEAHDCVVRAVAYPYGDNDSRELELTGDFDQFASGSLVQVSLIVPPALDPSPASNNDEVVPAKTVRAVVRTSKDLTASLSYGLSAALQVAGQIGVVLKISSAPVGDMGSGAVIVHPYATQTGTTNLKTGKSADLAAAINLKNVGNGLVIPPVLPLLPDGALLKAGFDYGTATRYELGTEIALAESRALPADPKDLIKVPSRRVVGRDAIINTIVDALMARSGILVTGSRGCGKSVIVDAVTQNLAKANVRPVRFACGSFADKSLPTTRDALKKALLEASWHAPSVIVLDDLDRLVPAELEHGDSSRSQQLAELISSEISNVTSRRSVCVLAAAAEKSALHSSLVSSAYVFSQSVAIKSPDKELRETIVGEALQSLGLATEALDMTEVAALTEGYQPGDLWTLVERVASSQALEPEAAIGTDAFTTAAAEYTPSSLRGVKLEKSSTKWSDIGGLVPVKRMLLETLEWPTKYAPIFAQSPLRLRSGLLLYGYPGSGKTMLASAVAGQTGLNFITVKGPEILNKYIGASEQSVRDLFDRAQAAKPCVLFFDEFDSIAPKRGHDSTGVTDRVVNQLLTQMDGAEGLDGVYVLAATSRPDLIDSALLRPGRLDKSLLCDMPNYDDRLEILSGAAAKMQLESDVDLGWVAKRTEGYTGADLQALMYNAYLDGVHGVLDAGEGVAATTTGDKDDLTMFEVGRPVVADPDSVRRYMNAHDDRKDTTTTPAPQAQLSVRVNMDQIRTAHASSKASISKKEAAKFKRIYAQFVSDREGNLPPGEASNEIGGRVTLG